jgi:hypothetical protein
MTHEIPGIFQKFSKMLLMLAVKSAVIRPLPPEPEEKSTSLTVSP